MHAIAIFSLFSSGFSAASVDFHDFIGEFHRLLAEFQWFCSLSIGKFIDFFAVVAVVVIAAVVAVIVVVAVFKDLVYFSAKYCRYILCSYSSHFCWSYYSSSSFLLFVIVRYFVFILIFVFAFVVFVASAVIIVVYCLKCYFGGFSCRNTALMNFSLFISPLISFYISAYWLGKKNSERFRFWTAQR